MSRCSPHPCPRSPAGSGRGWWAAPTADLAVTQGKSRSISDAEVAREALDEINSNSGGKSLRSMPLIRCHPQGGTKGEGRGYVPRASLPRSARHHPNPLSVWVVVQLFNKDGEGGALPAALTLRIINVAFSGGQRVSLSYSTLNQRWQFLLASISLVFHFLFLPFLKFSGFQ